MQHWLLKSEPDVFSFADLKKRPRRTEPWNGVRNYLARNYLRQMRAGDLGFFYHSNCGKPGIMGVVRIVKTAYPDPTQFDPKSEYHDAGSKKDDPRWSMVDVKWVADFKKFVSLEMLRSEPLLVGLIVLRLGNRLSVTPVDAGHFAVICEMGGLKR